MDEPILLAAHELKDAIENVARWKRRLIQYVKDELEYTKHKDLFNALLVYLESDSPDGYKSLEEAHNYLKDVADEVISFAKGEGYK